VFVQIDALLYPVSDRRLIPQFVQGCARYSLGEQRCNSGLDGRDRAVPLRGELQIAELSPLNKLKIARHIRGFVLEGVSARRQFCLDLRGGVSTPLVPTASDL
jgi:hypothetical protein